jgi:hypothetical protein
VVSLGLQLILSIFACRMISNCHPPTGGSKCTTILSYYVMEEIAGCLLESPRHDLNDRS